MKGANMIKFIFGLITGVLLLALVIGGNRDE